MQKVNGMKISANIAAAAAPPPGMRIADRIEAALFQQMLKSSGIERSGAAAEGGIGEEQLASFLTEEYARVLSARIDLRLTGFDQ